MHPTSLLIAFALLLNIPFTYGFERVFTFEEDVINQPPKGIVVEALPPSIPLIVVQREEEVEKPNKILALSGSRFPGVNFFSGVVYFSNIQNGKLSIRFKHTGEIKTIRTIGLIWRKGESETYNIDCDTAKSRIFISKDIKGKREKLEEEKITIPANEWHTLSVEFKNTEIRGFLNGKEVIKGNDRSIIAAGKVGFYIQANTIILADDFKIQGDDVP